MSSLKNLFTGRINRLEWIICKIYSFIILAFSILFAGIITEIWFTGNKTVLFIFVIPTYFLILFFNLSFDTRRLHDFGKSGQWIFILFFPVAIIPYFFILLFKKGTPQTNIYGDVMSKRNSFSLIINT